jgi:hypothetical protein
MDLGGSSSPPPAPDPVVTATHKPQQTLLRQKIRQGYLIQML